MSSKTFAAVGAGTLAALLPSGGVADAQSTFDGPYIGVHFGYGGPNTDGSFDGQTTDLASVGKSGVLGGGVAGWNFQYGPWLFGVEGDISAVDWGGATDFDEDASSVDLDMDLFGTVRGRLGVVHGNSLLFGTVGLAIADTDIKTSSVFAGSGDRKSTELGAVFGVGIETKVSPSLSFKVEGLWAVFDYDTDLSGLPDGNAGDEFELDDVLIARVGLNWHFGAGDGVNVTPAAVFDPVSDDRWSGLYLGGQIGFGGVDTTGIWDTAGSRFDLAGITKNSVLGGGQVGWNFQSGDWVFGIEGDVSLTDWDDEVGPDSEGDVHELDVNLFATIRGRAGMLFADTLIYGTAGVAILDTDLTVEIGSTEGDESITAVGGVFGAGIETFITDSISIKAEGLYVVFDDRTGISDLPDGDGGEFLKINDGFVFRTGVSWHLPM